jgi:hypothetical protein
MPVTEYTAETHENTIAKRQPQVKSIVTKDTKKDSNSESIIQLLKTLI